MQCGKCKYYRLVTCNGCTRRKVLIKTPMILPYEVPNDHGGGCWQRCLSLRCTSFGLTYELARASGQREAMSFPIILLAARAQLISDLSRSV